MDKKRVLGVIARGTDYRKEASELRKEIFYVRPIEKLIQYTQNVMNMWGTSMYLL